ncbi:MAG TPA: PLP-dependent aminotransferase family protein [Pseudonocardiaceae bacterium]
MSVEWSSTGLDFHLDLDPAEGRRHGVAEAIRHAIRDGRLTAGTRLPSTRALAADLGLARGTVTQAFDELAVEGYLRIRQGAGAVVVGMPGQAQPPHPMPPATPRPAPRWNLMPGRPDLTLFPRTTWLAASRKALTAASAADFGYGAPEGHPALRKALADYLGRTRGVVADPDAILVTAAYGQSLGLLAAVLRDRGEHTVAFENPSFAEFRRVMAWAGGLKTVGIPVDGKGVLVEELATRRDLGAVVVTPAHQYPLGSTLHPARRAELVEYAHATDTLIIEDDYDGEFRFDRQPIGALQALAPERVVYTGTASKTLIPGLRIAWLVLPSWLVEPMRAAKSLADKHTGILESLTLAEFLDAGHYDQQVRRGRARYRARRERLLGALGQEGITVWPDSAAAGLHLVLPLPEHSPPEEQVLAHLARHSVAVHGLASAWLGDGPKIGGLVVGYAAPAEHAFAPATNALIAALKLCWR